LKTHLKGTRPAALKLHYGSDELILNAENNYFSA